MLPKEPQNKHVLLNAFCSSLFIALLFYALPVIAQEQPIPLQSPGFNPANISLINVIQNIANQVPQLMQLVTALSYVMGMYFIFVGILRLKHIGESRTTMSQEHTLKEPLIYLAVGAALLYFPTTVQVGMSTFWTDPNPYGYLLQDDQWSQFINACYVIIQLVGVIAFIRGLVILSHLAGRGGQPGQFNKGLTHIIGGIFCINIYQFVQVMFITFFGVST